MPAAHRFVLVGDCCSGIPGGPHEATFAAIGARIAALNPAPEFLCFLGDHVDGLTDEAALRAQWRYWLDVEFAWARSLSFPAYHLTSNHNTYDETSERVFRETFPDLPQNGPAHDRGLSYYVLRDDLLLVFTNSATARLGPGRVETEWLAEVLERHQSIPHKLVLGHYPILPVNGYTTYPLWRIEPVAGARFWALLVEHEVLAYVCSHVIAFDTRARDGVLQICSGGAGTRYGPSGSFMRGSSQFFHFVACELTGGRLAMTAIDETGTARRRIDWPIGATTACQELADGHRFALPWSIERLRVEAQTEDGAAALGGSSSPRESILCGYDADEGPATIWIGREAGTLVVEITLEPGGPVGRWVADVPVDFRSLAIELVPALGPGGVMLLDRCGRRSSLATAVAEPFDRIRWPRSWTVGHGPSGTADVAFSGKVAARWACHPEMAAGT